MVYLFVDYLLLSVPFFFSGLCVSGALTHLAAEAGQVYFSDLAGAGIGAVIVLFLFIPLGGHGAVLLPGIVAALGALIFGLRRSPGRWSVVLSSVIMGFLVLLLWTKPSILDVQMSPYKSLKVALWHPESRILETRWNAFSRVDVVESPMVRFAPGLSLTAVKPIPHQLGITIDGDNMTALTRYDGQEASVAFISHMPDSLAYRVTEEEDVLVIETGGGLGILTALLSEARRVDAIFDNPLVFRLVSDQYSAFGGDILKDPRVVAIVQSGRSFLRHTNRSYDIIQYSPLSSFGASSTGIRGLHENYMFTVEAIMDALTRLKPKGVFSITQYLLPPPRQEIRLVHVVVDALARMGVSEPERHVAMIRTWGTFTLLLGRNPLSDEAIRRIRDFCEEERFDTVYFPGMRREQANRYNRFSHPIYFDLVQDLLSEAGRKPLVQEYLFDLRPSTDDSPFFFNFFRLGKIVPLYRAMHKKWQPFVEGGYLLPIILIQSIIASAFLILLPVLLRRSSRFQEKPGFRFWVLAYFCLLGLGYMFVEIVSIQKFVLFLDHPVFAMATVISGLLLSSGLGSFFSQRIPQTRLKTTLVSILFIIGLLIFGYLRVIPVVIGHFLGLGLAYREFVALICLFPLGFLMGLPFPLGIRFLKQVDPTTVPWAWCANGSFSVIGAVLSVVLAVGMGFSRVLMVAGLLYVVGGGVILVSFLNLTRHGNKADVSHVANG
jgi:spermidine synthase